MKGTLTADKHFIIFAFEYAALKIPPFIGPKYAPKIGYVWFIGFVNDISYMVDIMPMDEARHMYE